MTTRTLLEVLGLEPGNGLLHRFAQKVVVDDTHGMYVDGVWEPCWLWTGSIRHGAGGHGQIRVGERVMKAHRVGWLLFRDADLCPELVLDHLCTPAPSGAGACCVNPKHLEQVTQAENVRRGQSPVGLRWREAQQRQQA